MTDINDRLANLSVAHLCDACIRVGLPLRFAPLTPLVSGQRASGRARPVRHYGSVDVFLEALEASAPGDVLVVGNDGRDYEGCIGDLTAFEIQRAGLAGIVIWGRHRDTAILRTMKFPLFSLGACGRGPVRLDPGGPETFVSAQIGEALATAADYVAADDDGVLFVEASSIEAAVGAGESIRDIEQRQVESMKSGITLREQLRFAEYLRARADDPSFDFRTHLRALNAAIEE